MGVGQLRQIGTLWLNYPAQFGAGRRDEYYYLGDPNTGGPLVVRGELKALSGSRSLEAGDLTLNSSHSWRCRFGSALSGVGKTSKWVIDQRTFVINSYELIDQKKRYYIFRLTEER